MEVPTFIKYKSLRFIISSAPNDYMSNWYINNFKSHNVKHIVRVSESTYDQKKYETNGFIIHDLFFPDGSFPTKPIIKSWDLIVNDAQRTNTCVVIHCIAGLGRAPLMVAISLIKAGMTPIEAIQYIRHQRPHCFNYSQLRWLQNYKHSDKSCILM